MEVGRATGIVVPPYKTGAPNIYPSNKTMEVAVTSRIMYSLIRVNKVETVKVLVNMEKEQITKRIDVSGEILPATNRPGTRYCSTSICSRSR